MTPLDWEEIVQQAADQPPWIKEELAADEAKSAARRADINRRIQELVDQNRRTRALNERRRNV